MMNASVMNTPSPHTMMRSNYLPEDFVPSQHEIIVGRGKRVVHHEGNLKLRSLVQVEIKAYSAAKNRAAKTAIISKIYQVILADSPIGFVKRETATKKYFKMEHTAAKTTIAQYFRDGLADEYKSSKQYKQKLRDAIKDDEDSPLALPVAQQIRQVSSCSMKLPNMTQVVAQGSTIHKMADPLPQLAMSSYSGITNGTGVSSYNDLRTILTRTSALIDSEDYDSFEWADQALVDASPQQEQQHVSLFSSLLSSFGGSSVDLSSNPFEPTSISECEYEYTRSERV